MIDAAVRCPDHAAYRSVQAAMKLWDYVPEDAKKRIEAAVDEKIKEVGLEAFCTNMAEILQSPGRKIEGSEKKKPPEEKLDVTVLRATRDRYTINVLVAVDNPNNRSYRSIWLSCLAHYKGQPVYELSEIVTAVKPNGRTIQQVHMWTEEKMDSVDCRFTHE